MIKTSCKACWPRQGCGEYGGIVVEAALLLPLFFSFIVGMIVIIHIAVLEMELHTAVNETAKTVAGQLYPIRLVMEETKGLFKTDSSAELSPSEAPFLSDAWLPLARAIGQDVTETTVAALLKPLVMDACRCTMIDKSQLKVTAIILPGMSDGSNAYFGMEAQIVYRLPLPFIHKSVLLKKKAYERAWVGF